jgi:hypothetical protein
VSTTIMRQSRRVRLSGGFSLDEAARLYRATQPGTRMTCPTCGGGMRDVLGERSDSVGLVRCDKCGRALVFDRPRSQG